MHIFRSPLLLGLLLLPLLSMANTATDDLPALPSLPSIQTNTQTSTSTQSPATEVKKPAAALSDASQATKTTIVDAQNKGLNSAADLSTSDKSEDVSTNSKVNDPLKDCIGKQGAELKQCIEKVVKAKLPPIIMGPGPVILQPKPNKKDAHNY